MYLGLGEKCLISELWKEILKNTWASEKNSEEYLGLGKKF
jgi:hypothetical protein